MSSYDYGKVLADSTAKLEDLRRQRQILELEIAKMEQVVGSLRMIVGDEEMDIASTGLTDAVRAVLKGETVTGRSAPDIREGMLAMGFELSRYSQPLAAIHVVLKRLERNGEVVELEGQPKRYWWALNGVSRNEEKKRNRRKKATSEAPDHRR